MAEWPPFDGSHALETALPALRLGTYYAGGGGQRSVATDRPAHVQQGGEPDDVSGAGERGDHRTVLRVDRDHLAGGARR